MAGRGLICVSVAAEHGDAVLAAVAPVVDLVDVIEIRMDALRDPDLAHCIAALPIPVLVTNRPTWEGGQFAGSEEDRIDSLCQALQAGARYADIELAAAPELRARLLITAKQCKARVIVSRHDFEATPSVAELQSTLAEMQASGADIGKIVVTAASPVDALRILALQTEAIAAGFPLCAFAMGAAGTITRLATLHLGGFMTYAALSPELATAPGQLAVHELRRLLSLLERQP